ncbi:MAG: cell division protein FtsQ/DivIB [Pseudomonadota bacterium]
MVTPLLAPPSPCRRWRTGWLLAGAALVGFVWAGVYALRDGRFRVRHVLVQNETVQPGDAGAGTFRSHVSAVEIRHLASIQWDAELWQVDLASVVQGVLNHPWVAEVDASRRWPDTVVIRIVEHRPQLLLQQQGLYYVDAQGEVFKRARSSDLDYPVLTGLAEGAVARHPEVARRVLRDAVALLDTVDASGEFTRADLSEIHFDEHEGFTLVLRSGAELALGFSEPAERLGRLARMRERGLDPSLPSRVDLVPERIALVTPLPPVSPQGLD